MKPSLVASSRREAAPPSSRACRRTFARRIPGRKAAKNGAWCGSMPSSPSVVTAMTSSASPSKTTCVGVTSLNAIVLGTCHPFGVLADLVDSPGVEERGLRQIVDLPFEDLLERSDRLRKLHVLAGPARELFGDEERLREESLNAARAPHGNLIVLGEFFYAQDRDDVLEVLIPLEHLLNSASDGIVFLADDLRIEDA